jgi:hypothetical protein
MDNQVFGEWLCILTDILKEMNTNLTKIHVTLKDLETIISEEYGIDPQ